MGLTGRQRHIPVSAWEQGIIRPQFRDCLNRRHCEPQHLVCMSLLGTKSGPSIVFVFRSFTVRNPDNTWVGMGGARPAHGRGWVGQTACKPGSVSDRTGRMTTIHLGRPLPGASRDQPGRRGRKGPWHGLRLPCRHYSVLLPVGFTVPPPLPEARCALTAPFHPYPPGRSRAGGLLSVALSLGSPPPGITRHRISVEPGLSSHRGLHPDRRPSSRLARALGRALSLPGQRWAAASRPFSMDRVSSSATPSHRRGRQ